LCFPFRNNGVDLNQAKQPTKNKNGDTIMAHSDDGKEKQKRYGT
tara:strand:- start:304 stop:435 length:132 start_codon:yes stop_codon:yes gene_type:complete